MKNVDVAVLYTDGSHLTSPMGASGGIHGCQFKQEEIGDGSYYRQSAIPEGTKSSR
ncbi:hypothetical protein KW817_24110 [Enterobacter quasiroggenkampii]|uniref:hypothetical protein n=1 Tax=Enterobacter quasiroggenkampii TaxID=2497436 RepID=UPI0021D209B1|nr:hypothetical protein [Enterobacter quasiroggenkampii]MCU6406040.1 hypothetical protein [Enterobacter quasiroggenkampii]